MPTAKQDDPESILDWRLLLAAALLVLAPILGGIFYQSQYDERATDNAREYAEYANQKIAEACRGVSEIELVHCFSDARIKAELEKRAYQYNQDDLIAQRKNALWTQIMAWAAFVGVSLSVVGVLLVWRTFRATREANEIARQVSAAELRPYLFVDRLEAADRSRTPVGEMDEFGHAKYHAFHATVVIRLKNFGKVPARNIKVFAKEYFARQREGRFWDFSFNVISLPSCAPGHERKLFGHLYVGASHFEDFNRGRIQKIIRLRYTFEDDIGTEYQERAAYFVNGNELDTFYLLTEMPVGELRAQAKERELDFGDGKNGMA